MNVLTYIGDNWKQIGECCEVVAANIYAAYAFICNHGGVRTMWAKFIGPKQTTDPPKQ